MLTSGETQHNVTVPAYFLTVAYRLTVCFTVSPTHAQLHTGAVSGGRCVRLAADLPDVIEWGVSGANLALEHLFVGFPEVLRQEGVDDRVDRGVAVSQTVGGHPQHKRGLG